MATKSFNYKKVKYSFVKKCLQHIKENDLEDVWPCTYEALIKYKQTVLEAKELMKSEPNSLTAFHKSAMEKYDVANVDNKQVLLTKEHQLKVVDIFSCFDVIYRAHSTNEEPHRDVSQTMNFLNPMYFIPKMAVELFVTICPGCLSYDDTNENNLIGNERTNESSSAPRLLTLLQSSQKPTNQKSTAISSSTKSDSTPILIPCSNLPSPTISVPLPREQDNKRIKLSFVHSKKNDLKKTDNFFKSVTSDIIEIKDEPETTKKDLPIQTEEALNKAEDFVESEQYVGQSGKVFTDIITMGKSDGNFVHLLIYMDILTKYTILRPLTQIEEEEISMELFKIFADFGLPPEISCLPNFCLLPKVLRILESNFGTGKIKQNFVDRQAIDLEIHVNSMISIGRIIKNRLTLWMAKTESDNWAVGCYLIQQNFNTQKMQILDYTAPYQNFFNNNRLNYSHHSQTHHSDELSKVSTQFDDIPLMRSDSESQKVDNILDSATVTSGSGSNTESDTIKIEENLEEDVVIKFEEENQTPLNNVEIDDVSALQIDPPNKLPITAPCQLEDEDSLDAFQNIEDSFDCEKVVRPKKSKRNPSNPFEKTYESFAKKIIKTMERNSDHDMIQVRPKKTKSNKKSKNVMKPGSSKIYNIQKLKK